MSKEPENQKRNREIYIVLDNVRSVHNVGSIFRTADCLGVNNIILVGVTPAPLDRFGRPRKDFAKVSLGAERKISWRYFKNFREASRHLKDRKIYCLSVEQGFRSLDYKKIKPKFPIAFIFGNEVEGVSKNFLDISHAVAEIPMYGSKESLNVSVAVGIALTRILDL